MYRIGNHCIKHEERGRRMRIGLIDVDGHNFPNIPLMKISAWHKSQGDSVEWYHPMFSGHMDKVYMSKVFAFTPDYEYMIDADEIIKGGSGYCIELVDGKEIYHAERDRNLRNSAKDTSSRRDIDLRKFASVVGCGRRDSGGQR